MKKRISMIVVAVMLVMAMLPAASLAVWEQTELPVGMDLTAMETTDLDGNPVAGDIFGNGKAYTILSVWATWATPSVDSLKVLQEFYSTVDNTDGGINILGVLYEDATSSPAAAQGMLEKLGVEFPTVHFDNVLWELYSNSFAKGEQQCVPVHYLVDTDGVVLDARVGSLDEELDVITWITLRAQPLPGDRDVDENSRGFSVSHMNTVDLYGNKVDGSVFAENKLTVLSVWATWCTPCKSQVPFFNQLNNEFEDVGVLGVLYLDDHSNTADVIQRAQNAEHNYGSVLFDSVLDELFDTSFNGRDNAAIPVTYLVNSEGTVVAAKLAAFASFEQLTEWVKAYMDEPTADETDARVPGNGDAAEVPAMLLGDVNGNSCIDSADATLVLRNVVGANAFTGIQASVGDMNQNGIIDSGDAGLILRLSVGGK